MIKRLKLDRFRAFREATLEFAPLTVIAGQNSSGKSSIIQALNAVLQSSQGRSFPFDLVLNAEKAHLGGFKNVIHGHDARNSFGIELGFAIASHELRLSCLLKHSDEEGHLFPRQVRIDSSNFGSLAIDWNQRSQSFWLVLDPADSLVTRLRENFLNSVERTFDSAEDGRRQNLLVDLKISDPSQIGHALKTLYDAAAEESREGLVIDVQDFSELLAKATENPFFEVLRRGVAEALQQLRNRCGYIGPMRASPSRYFPLAGGDMSSDPSGEGTSRILAKWKDRKSSLIGSVKSALSELQLASDITVSVEHDEFLKVGIKPHGRLYSDSLADVGFGLSQVLPMIVGDLNLPPNGTLLVNQPEIHLHPSSQALLANYFVQRLDTRQYIVETHSEYLINRIRLLVAKKVLRSSDVLILYCTADEKGGSSAHKVRVEEDGSLTGAPAEFFTTYAADAFGIAMAVIDEEDEGEDDAPE